jgi:hypothetical protein
MAIVKTLGGDFEKLDAKFAKEEIIFTRKDATLSVMKVKDVACTYFVDEGAVRTLTSLPGLRVAFDEARKRWPEPANKEIVVVFKDGRWAYVRAANSKDAKIIHDIAPDDQAPPLASNDGGVCHEL